MVLSALQVLPPLGRLRSHVAPNAGDPVLLTWIMEHQARAVLTDPSRLYAANIFFPEPAAIAWSDNLTAFVPAYLAVWLASGRESVLAYNVVTWVAFAGGSLAVLLLARRLLRSPWAAVVVAVAFSLAVIRRSAVGHTQLAGFVFLPLSLTLLMDLVERRRVRTALAAGVCLAGLWYSAVYFFVLAVVVVPAFTLTWALRHRRDLDRRLLALWAAVAATAALLVAPSLPPYLELQQRSSFARADDELLTIGPHSFTQPGSIVYRWLDQVDATREGSDAFVGFVVLALAVVALAGAAVVRLRPGRAQAGTPARVQGGAVDGGGDRGDDRWTAEARRRRFALPLAVACTLAGLVALGPDDGVLSAPYRALRTLVPGLDSARALNRFWVLPALGFALLAGRGFERVAGGLARRAGPPAVPVAAVVVVAALVLELFVRPASAPVADDPDLVAVNEALAELDPGVVTELPVPTLPGYPYILAVRQLRSLEDGLPRVEGYSGDAPDGLPAYFQALTTFPAEPALAALRQAGVRHVVLHGAPTPCASRFGRDELDALVARAAGSPAVAAVTRVGAHAVVTLTAAPRGGPLDELAVVPPVARAATPCRRD